MVSPHSRILIFSPHYFPEAFRINEMAGELVKEGFHVTVITGIPNYPKGEFFDGYGFFKRSAEIVDGVQIYRVPVIPRGSGGSIRLLLNYLSYMLSASVFSLYLLKRKFDNIFVFQLSPITVAVPALILAKFRKTPSSIWVQDLWPESLSATRHVRRAWILKLAGRICSFIYRGFDSVLIQSPGFETIMISKGIKKERITYLPNWAESSYLDTSTAVPAQEYTGEDKQFRVVFTGNLGYAQDLGTLIETAYLFKDQKNIHWYFVGDGACRLWAEEEVRKKDLQATIHFLGSFASSRMPAFFAGSDALLVSLRPDPAVGTTIPSKVQAYLAAGRPILGALDGEGARVIRDSGAGFVTRAGDSQGLASSLEKLLKLSEPERARLGRKGQDFFLEHFEQSKIIARLKSHFFEQKRQIIS